MEESTLLASRYRVVRKLGAGGMSEVFEAVDRLPERQRQMVLHRYCDGLSVSEIAAATGSPVGTVTKYLSRAHARLRKLLLKDVSE